MKSLPIFASILLLVAANAQTNWPAGPGPAWPLNVPPSGVVAPATNSAPVLIMAERHADKVVLTWTHQGSPPDAFRIVRSIKKPDLKEFINVNSTDRVVTVASWKLTPSHVTLTDFTTYRWIDTKADPATAYTYTVTALDDDNESKPSNLMTIGK